MAKKWLITVMSLEEEKLELAGLPKDKELGSLPNLLQEAVLSITTNQALGLKLVYLLDDEQKNQILQRLEEASIPYHQYAQERGEKCRDPRCTEHRQCVVIELDDRRPDA